MTSMLKLTLNGITDTKIELFFPARLTPKPQCLSFNELPEGFDSLVSLYGDYNNCSVAFAGPSEGESIEVHMTKM